MRSPLGEATNPELLALCFSGLQAAQRYLENARGNIAARVSSGSERGRRLSDAEQFAAHGYAWCATYVAALAELLNWANREESVGRLGEIERLILQAAYGEYLAQLRSGMPISQSEIVRPIDLGVRDIEAAPLHSAAVNTLIEHGNTALVRTRLAALLIQSQNFGDPGIDDDALIATRDQIRRYAQMRIAPEAHTWHRENRLIPLDIVGELSTLGVFGLTISSDYGGLGLGKVAMCLVTEELSRCCLAAGSLGTRSEIAAELIATGGTHEQKVRWLSRIASGDVLPTAVFTEPAAGSDLGAVRTRAVRLGDIYRISGTKTWITHAARADLMTLLARTGGGSDHRGLSIFLASKPRGGDEDPFPVVGISGGEIPVIGYRGMREYEMAFTDFEVSAADLLGGTEGNGFRQLMRSLEAARIQTAARSVGVAQNALELGATYAASRRQFGHNIVEFPRVAGKLAWMAVETMLARQLTYFAARAKDDAHRCDVEAGMAKLLAARVAWSNADSALQIHGGNGYAEEYAISRVLCDARILNIFEGTAEIQANVVAAGLLLPVS